MRHAIYFNSMYMEIVWKLIIGSCTSTKNTRFNREKKIVEREEQMFEDMLVDDETKKCTNWKFGCMTHLLQFVMVDDVLIGRARLCEGIQLVLMVHVPPEGSQVGLEWKFRYIFR
jgi:hypothetical protein